MFTRYFSSAALGLLVATGLLWLMQFLIDIGPEVFIEDPPDIRLAWIHERKPPPVDDDGDPPDRPPPPVDPPPDHRPPGDGDDGYLVDPPTVGGPGPVGDWKVPGITMTDGPLVAMMAVRPVYPVRAISLGLEGHVIVQFDVDELGAVVNVTVVEASHRLFEQPAIDAAKRSKFRPRVVNGTPVTTAGVRKLYRFEMEQ
jgi:protein TonB